MITRASSTDLQAIASMCSERVFKGFLALMWVGHDYYTGPVSRRSPFEATMMKRPIEWAAGVRCTNFHGYDICQSRGQSKCGLIASAAFREESSGPKAKLISDLYPFRGCGC